MKTPAFLQRLRHSPRILLSLFLPLALFLLGWWFGLPSGDGHDHGKSAADETIWTCSMHPQIRQPNPGLCPICNMDLIPLASGETRGLREVSVSEEAAALLDVRVTPVMRAPAVAERRLFGRIEYDERRITTVTARVGGRIERLYPDFTGSLIRNGDHLAEIYSPELLVAQKELIEARRAMERGGSPSTAVETTRGRLLEAAREKLRLLQLSPQQISRIEQNDSPDPTLQIDSPQDGVVVAKLVNEGNYVKTGDPILRLAKLDSVWLIVDAYESDLPWIRYGQDVQFTVDSVPGEEFHGRVSFIDPSLDPMRRSASVRINVPNPRGLLKPGVFAKVRIVARMTAAGNVIDPSLAGKWISPMHPEIVKDVPGQCDICGMDLVPAETLGFVGESPDAEEPLLVPRSAVLRTGDRAIAYVKLPEESDPVFEGRQIVLGPAVGTEFIVREGLSEGELVVSRGAFMLDSELQIQGKPSMMNRNAGLEERPAGTASSELRGRWSPLLRELDRIGAAVRAENRDALRSHISQLGEMIRETPVDGLDDEERGLWSEFAGRLQADLAVAERQVGQAPENAWRIVSRGIEDAALHLGLSYQPLAAPAADPAVTEALRPVTRAYQPLAAALAADDDAKAKAAADSLLESIPNNLPAALREAAEATATADGIDDRRAAFHTLSDILIGLIRDHALDRLGNLYVVHCPMAFQGNGADWLSDSAEVINPYFGDAMLHCGSVTDTLSRETGDR
ncbi:MAG: efflux RND transporter periplasmic adaptor subunit [Akkermansiaceae bacterium]|nr:efflux RND transporter periplasmic adaptor subunit [Akkermansiaceae bacterium]